MDEVRFGSEPLDRLLAHLVAAVPGDEPLVQAIPDGVTWVTVAPGSWTEDGPSVSRAVVEQPAAAFEVGAVIPTVAPSHDS